MKVFVAGEGKTELGEWAIEAPYRSNPVRPGVLEQLARKVRRDGWSVIGAKVWKDVPKYRAGGFRKAEQTAVLGVVLAANEAGADVALFSRDQDRDEVRTERFEAALASVTELFPSVRVAGGHAVPCVEAWLLALAGERRSEQGDAKTKFHALGVRARDVEALIEAADLGRVPDDATSLKQWHERMEKALGATAFAGVAE